MAVREAFQGRGVGRLLIQAAVDLVVAESVTTILVATAAADIGNLRFYQRQGFRMRSVERDAFTPATGYPPGTLIDGIELRDRVWLDRTVLLGSPAAGAVAARREVALAGERSVEGVFGGVAEGSGDGADGVVGVA